MKQKHFLFFFLAFLFSLFPLFSFGVKKLEVSYPRLSSGDIITSASPLEVYVKYIFNFGVLLGITLAVFMITLGGVIYVFSVGHPEMIQRAKERIFGGISGLILLITSYLIIISINPDLVILKLTPLKRTPGLYLVGHQGNKVVTRAISLMGISNVDRIKPPISEINFTQIRYVCRRGVVLVASFYKEKQMVKLFKQVDLRCGDKIAIQGKSFDFQIKTPGVYLFTKENCRIGIVPPARYTNSNPDLAKLKNRINSVQIIHRHPKYYIAILYDKINQVGKCYQVNPNISCDNLDRPSRDEFGPIADSISVYEFSRTGTKNGEIIFYREPFFDKSMGYFKLTNRQILSQPVYDLKDLKFEVNGKCTVPRERQDCVKWDEITGNCLKYQCPVLAGKGCAKWNQEVCTQHTPLAEPNISSIRIRGNYLVMFVHYKPTKDAPIGKWTYCQAFPTVGDTSKLGPRDIKWEYILQAGKVPNYVVIWPIKSK